MSLTAPLIYLVMNSFWISSYGTHKYSPHKDPHWRVLPIKYGKGFILKGSSCFVNDGSFCTIHLYPPSGNVAKVGEVGKYGMNVCV